MSKRIPYIGAFLMLAVICSVLLTGCSKSLQSQSASRTELVMSTVVTITLYGEQAQEGVNAAFQKAKDLEKILSSQNEKSELHQVNQSAYDHEVEVSDTLFTVAQRSLQYCKETDGALDCTIGKINDLWAFGTGNAKLPDEEEITPLLVDKGYEQVQLDEEKRTIRFLNPNIQLDFGATAKGFAADEIKNMLVEEYGITCGIINLGGNIITIGAKYDGQPWGIGITDPNDTTRAVSTEYLTNATAVTSGNYERYFIEDGVRYHHILDPKTGYSANNGLISTTIITENSMLADALSTATYVMGLEKAYAYIESLDDVEAIFITDDGTVVKTSGITDDTFEGVS